MVLTMIVLARSGYVRSSPIVTTSVTLITTCNVRMEGVANRLAPAVPTTAPKHANVRTLTPVQNTTGKSEVLTTSK